MAIEFRLPDIGEGVHEGEIVKWLVHPGDVVQEDQPLVEVMTDKVTAEIPSPMPGVIREIRGKEGDVIKVGSVIVVFDPLETVKDASKESSKEAASRAADSPVPPSPSHAANGGNGKTVSPTAAPAPVAVMPRPAGGKVLAAPATRKLARDLGVDLSVVAGSGPAGRVTPDDVRRAGGGPAVAVLPPSGGEERRPFAGMRRKIAEHLVESKRVAPHFAYVEEVDMTEVVRLREQLLPVAQARGVKLSYLPFIIKAVIAGLRAYPIVNASLDEARQEIVLKHYYNLGIATATEQGLVVPVLHGAEAKGLFDLAAGIQSLSERARSGKLSLDDLKGGTFTLTSIGSIGGLFGIPIINHPEVAILGINKITPRPVVRDGQIVVRDVMYLSLSCDHRVVDGADGALFIKTVVEHLEAPARLLLEG